MRLLNNNKYKNMLTEKEKKFLVELLKNNFTLQALDFNYDNGNEDAFKEEHQLSFIEAEKMIENIINKLNK